MMARSDAIVALGGLGSIVAVLAISGARATRRDVKAATQDYLRRRRELEAQLENLPRA